MPTETRKAQYLSNYAGREVDGVAGLWLISSDIYFLSDLESKTISYGQMFERFEDKRQGMRKIEEEMD